MSAVASSPELMLETIPMKKRSSASVAILVSGGFLIVLLLASLTQPWWAPDPNAYNLSAKFQPPSLAHLFGTDQFGRDTFLRVIAGAKLDLALALLGTVIPGVIGIVLGAAAGYVGGWMDTFIMRTADLIQAFPQYILLVALTLFFGAGWQAFIVAAAVSAWVTYARLVRGIVLQLKGREYIDSAKAAGIGTGRVLFRHVIPNTLPQVFVYAASDLVLALAFLCSLGYLGLGIQPPGIEWGQMIAEGQSFLRSYWWISFAPGLAILLVGISMRLLAGGLEGKLAR